MEITTINALITGGCSIAAAALGGTIGFFIKNAAVRSGLRSVPRRDKLRGDWKGVAKQTSYSDYSMVMHLEPARKSVSGHGTFGDRPVKLSGGYYDDRYLKIDYKPQDPAVVAYGSLILELSPTADALDGKFVAYGPESKAIVIGEFSLRKA